MIICLIFLLVHQKTIISSLFLSSGLSYKKIETPFNFNKKSEDTDAVFFDSDNDGDDDLYVHLVVNLSQDTMVI